VTDTQTFSMKKRAVIIYMYVSVSSKYSRLKGIEL